MHYFGFGNSDRMSLWDEGVGLLLGGLVDGLGGGGISVSSVTAAMGSALTAGHFGKAPK